MSHGQDPPDDYLYIDPKEVISQYSVEWVSLRRSLQEVKEKLEEVQTALNRLDAELEEGKMSEREHMEKYRELWLESTQILQVKREVESRLAELQREIRKANRQLKLLEQEKQKRERIEQEKAHAMVEWMALKQGFDLVGQRRKEISREMDLLEMKRRQNAIKDEQYRSERLDQIRQLAELRNLETDVKGRLSELLEIIRK